MQILMRESFTRLLDLQQRLLAGLLLSALRAGYGNAEFAGVDNAGVGNLNTYVRNSSGQRPTYTRRPKTKMLVFGQIQRSHILPARRSAANPPAAAAVVDGTYRWTDARSLAQTLFRILYVEKLLTSAIWDGGFSGTVTWTTCVHYEN